jgi:hypothetical protein
MTDWFIRAKKPQRREVREQYPNLAKSKVKIKISEISTQKDLESLSDKKMKKVVEKQLERKMRINEDFEWSKKELVDVVKQYPDEDEDNDPIFEDEVKIPEEYRTEGDSKKKDKQALRA